MLFCSCLGYYEEPDEPIAPAVQSKYIAIQYARAELDSSLQLLPPRNSEVSGKIYVFSDILLVGEKWKGFHVYDNSDPTDPQNIKFIQCLGATDVAIRGNVLYLNQGTDLIALEYNFGMDSLKLLKRVPNAFPEIRSPQGFNARKHQDSVTVGWKLKRGA